MISQLGMALGLAAALSAIAAIAADWNEQRRRSFYLLKPLTTLLILALAATKSAPASAPYQQFVVGALALSTVGDVCLMFSGQRWFVGGLSSFLLAHLLFIAAFLQGLPAFHVPLYAYLTLPYGAALLWFLLPRAGDLKAPVIVYCLVILAMLFCAAARDAALGTPSARLALAGAVLFLASDSLLALRQFGGRYAGAQALILSSYWLAVGLIAGSV